jgi:hypothetical protein
LKKLLRLCCKFVGTALAGYAKYVDERGDEDDGLWNSLWLCDETEDRQGSIDEDDGFDESLRFQWVNGSDQS